MDAQPGGILYLQPFLSRQISPNHLSNEHKRSIPLDLMVWGNRSFCKFITHIHQKPDFLILHSPIQRNTQPMGLIHVPAGVYARFLPEGANQSRVTLEIHHLYFAFAGKFQILSGDIHNHSKPLFVPTVAKHQEAWIPGKKILTGGAVSIRQVGG